MIDGAALIGMEVDTAAHRVLLRLAVVTGSGPGAPREERVLVLHGVSRVAACLRTVRFRDDPGQRWAQQGTRPREAGPPILLSDTRELNDWLRRWSGHQLSGQAEELFDAEGQPEWLGWPSLDVAWPRTTPDLHSFELWLGDSPRAGAHELELWIEFGQLERRGNGRPGAGGVPAAGGPGGPAARHRGPGGPAARTGAGQRAPGTGRRAPAGARRKRAAATLGAVTVVGAAAVAWAGVSGGAPAPTRAPRSVQAVSPAAPGHTLPAAESGLLPRRLATPISREVVVAGSHGRLTVLGGLTTDGASASGVFSIRTATGSVASIGSLRAPLHDAGGAVLGNRTLVFGGGSSATVATVQSFPAHASRGGTAVATGALPVPRSDMAAVTIGATAYLVGGYDGSRPDAGVLATTNGRSFTTVASLRVPVRYPAVAALRGKIYVFGGQAITGHKAGAPLNIIQVVDPARHTASIIGHLPEPLAGAAAVTLGSEVFVAGGESSVAQPRTPGVGTTQLGPGEASAASPTSTHTVSTIWAFDPASGRLLAAGHLQVPVSHAGVAVIGSTAWIVGGESDGALVAAVQILRANAAFGWAGAAGAGSPYFGGRLLIADRGNDRLLLLSDTMHIVWKYPSATTPRNRLGFYFPDDAFFVDHGTAILSNQEQNETIVKIAYPSGKITWSYGHPHHASTANGYLHEPDDAYLLKNGQITVADADNCRVLVLSPNGTVARQIGTTGVCVHHPPTSLGMPNGDTPLANGNLLISEIIGSWVSEYTMTGKLVWTTHLPISYPSDPQQVGADRYLIADYASPGGILQFNRKGRILYRYQPASGPGMLNHPSLSEMLPSGVLMVNDDYNDRMVAIDPATGALVWQYGVTGRHGTAPGRLHTPDGFDLLLPNGSTPTHPVTG